MVAEITELIPYLDERLLTEELLVELGFERHTDEMDGSSYTYYTYGSNNKPRLYAHTNDGKWVVSLQNYAHIAESPYWIYYGSVKMLMICLQGDGDV